MPTLARNLHRALHATLVAATLAACTPPVQTHTVAVPQATAQTHAQAQAQAQAQGPLPVPPSLVPLTSPAGQARLLSAVSRQSYWPLAQYFETQRNEAYCSVASAVMALNALGVKRPSSSQYPDFAFFSQQDFFATIDPQVADAAGVSKEGMTLDQLSAALAAFPVEVTKFHAADLSLDRFRTLIRDTVAADDRFALLNFGRAQIGETGGGHWSPLAAYDPATDSALLLDVARYKYPALWVPVANLYAGALAPDSVSGLSRGMVIVGKRTN